MQTNTNKQNSIHRFYDVHMHAFDLSHPNLTAFLFNEEVIGSLINWKTKLMSLAAFLIPKRILSNSIKKYLSKNPYFKNTLSFYEDPLEYQLLMLDWYLKNSESNELKLIQSNNEFSVGNEVFNKMVLCPLVVDFTYKYQDESGVFYNKTPHKPIAKQIGDLFYAIRTYYRFNLSYNSEINKVQLSEISDKTLEEIKQEKLFEIYPFMGINTQNYSLEELKGTSSKCGLLDKYFAEFSATESGSDRQKRLYDKIGKFNGKMFEEDKSIYKNIFVGIKLYPPLGFDPFPEDSNELEKVEFLYKYCIEKRIPIMVHCSDGGFKVGDLEEFTDPRKRWTKVLAKYPQLTVCFAHFGNQRNGDTKWRKRIIELCEYENVFTDISCNDADDKYYNDLQKCILKNPILTKKLLYGSDFSINMFSSKVISYNQYLKAFLDAELASKLKMSSENVERYMFGENLIA